MKDCPVSTHGKATKKRKVSKKMIVFHEKDSRFNSRIIRKILFSHWTSTNQNIWVEDSVFAIQHIENRKRFTEVSPTSRDQTNPFAYSCSFTFHTSYKNDMIGHGGGGGGTLSKCSKTIYYKNLLVTYFEQTCR